MSGAMNRAFEDSELDVLEAGYRIDETAEGKETVSNSKSANCLAKVNNAMDNFLSKYSRQLVLVLLNALILIYFVFATIYWRNNNSQNGFSWCYGYGMLILLLAFGYGGVLYCYVVKPLIKKALVACSRSFHGRVGNIRRTNCFSIVVQTAIYTCIFVAIIIFLVFDTVDSRERLLSLVGIFVLFCLGWIFSKHPGSIKWRPVLSGLIMQFIFGLLTIRWSVGRAIFQCISEKVTTFLEFAKSGARFIFSERLVDDGVFAFSVLPVIYYFSFIIQVLYYLGVMQWIILNLGRCLQAIHGTTICESVNCASNIFIGMTESPLLLKPYLKKLTSSELHAIMCSGFATVSGTILAAYIGFGANPAHLIVATVMAAPATLCYSKLIYPETEQSLLTNNDIKLEKSKDSSLMDAASKGAAGGIPLVLGIIANIIAFISFVALINGLLGWLGMLVGYKALSFELILSKVFIPISWIMGVPWEHCETVATLIGLKTIVNEFVAYQKLGEFKRMGKLFGRSEAIATFAICGFANPGSVGITFGVLTSLAPEKKQEISEVALRAFVAGCAVCFLTASTAGLLMDDAAIDNTAIVRNMTTEVTATTTVS